MYKNESDIYPYTVTDVSREDALIIAPHPDDESLGCAGSIIRHVKAKSRVKVVFLTDGDKGDFEGRFGKEYVKMRRQSAERAMEILGVTDYQFLGYPDRELFLREHDAADRLLRVVEAFSPGILYAPSPCEAHPDHKASFRLAWELRKKCEIPLAFYEVLMALFPNVLVDITEEMEQKKRAIAAYSTEIYYNDYIAKVEGINRFRTATLPRDIKYAEGFILMGKGSSASSLAARLVSLFA